MRVVFTGVVGLIPAIALGGTVDLSTQGRLVEAGGSVVNGTHDLTFKLWDVGTGGASPLSTHELATVDVSGGYYSVVLSGVDTADLGGATWIGVTIGAPTGPELSPRMPLTAAPAAASLSAGASAAGEFTLAAIDGSTACTDQGAVSFEPTDKVVQVCVDSAWAPIAASSGTGSQSNPGVSCRTLHLADPSLPSDVYWVDADGSGDPIDVYCDMDSDQGGWTVVGRAGDTNALPDEEFNAAVGDHSMMDLTYDHGSPTSPQHLRGIQRLLEPARTTVEIQYYCYQSTNPTSTNFWVTTAPITTTQLVTSLTPANPDFVYTGMTLRNKNGDTTTTGNYAFFERDNPAGGNSCGNSYAGQNGMKWSCGSGGQGVMSPPSIWYMTHHPSPGTYTEVNSCGSVGGAANLYYVGEIRIR